MISAVWGPVRFFENYYQHPDAGAARGGRLEGVVADTVVTGDHQPAALADHRQPLLVLGVLREVVIVDLDPEPGLSQGRGHALLAEAAIDEEDRVVEGSRSAFHAAA